MAESEKVIVEVGAKDTATPVLEKTANNVESWGKKMSGSFGTAADASKKFALGLAAGGVAIGGFIALSIKAASDAEVQMTRVNTILTTMGKKGTEARDGILKAAGAVVKLGFDDEAAAESITKFYQKTGDLTEATKLNTIAMDLARAKHIELSDAATLVNQVLAGNGKVLKQYGIDIKDSATPLEALNELQGKIAGQAVAFSQTFAGQTEVLKAQFGNLEEAIGAPFLGAITAVLTKFNDLIAAMGGADGIAKMLHDKFVEIEPYFGLIAAAITGALIPALITAAGEALILFNSFSVAASALLPWAAAAVLLYEAYQTNFLGIKDTVDQFVAWLGPEFEIINGIVKEHNGVLGTMKDAWAIAATEWMGLFELIRLRVNTTFQNIGNTINGIWLDIQTVWYSTWNAIGTWFEAKLNSILDFFKGWYDKINGWVQGILQSLGLVESKVTQPSARGGKSGPVQSTSRFAAGGIVHGPAGEDNVPAMLTAGEIVLNAAMQNKLADNLKGGNSSGGGNTTIQLIFSHNNLYGDDEQFMQKLGDQLMTMLQPHLSFPTF